MGRHSYFGGMFNLDDYDAEGEYCVFDDFEWKFLPMRKQWVGCQLVFTVTDKYRRKFTVNNKGKPSIFLFNKDNDPRKDMTTEELAYAHANAKFIWLHSPLFSQRNPSSM